MVSLNKKSLVAFKQNVVVNLTIQDCRNDKRLKYGKTFKWPRGPVMTWRISNINTYAWGRKGPSAILRWKIQCLPIDYSSSLLWACSCAENESATYRCKVRVHKNIFCLKTLRNKGECRRGRWDLLVQDFLSSEKELPWIWIARSWAMSCRKQKGGRRVWFHPWGQDRSRHQSTLTSFKLVNPSTPCLLQHPSPLPATIPHCSPLSQLYWKAQVLKSTDNKLMTSPEMCIQTPNCACKTFWEQLQIFDDLNVRVNVCMYHTV